MNNNGAGFFRRFMVVEGRNSKKNRLEIDL